MRVGVAITAVAKGNSNIAWLLIGFGTVAECAADLNMQSGERISTQRMIKVENVDCFPLDKVVALEAIRSEAAFVRVLMTINTARGHSQERPAKICNSNRCQLTSVDALRRMTTVTGQTDMLSF